MIAAIGIRMNIAAEVFQEIQGPLFASIMREVIDRQRRTIAPSHIYPQPGLLEFSVPLDLKRDDGIIGEDHFTLKHRLFKLIFQRADGIVDLKHPTCLGGPGDVHPLSLKDSVLAVERQMIGKLAHEDIGKKSQVGLALRNGMIRHGSNHRPGAVHRRGAGVVLPGAEAW